MQIRNLTINGISFSDSLARENRILIDDFKSESRISTFTLDRQTSTGTLIGRSVMQGRLFTIRGKVFGSPAERQAGIDYLLSAIPPDTLVSVTPLLEMYWQDLSGREYKTSVQVYQLPTWQSEVANPIDSFEFVLISPEATIKSDTDKSRIVTISNVGGFTMPHIVPVVLGGDPGAFTATNDGNYPAPVRLEIIGSITNPKITNRNNGRFFGLTGITTTQLVLDGTVKPLVVTDVIGGVTTDVSGYRLAGSKTPLLFPGANLISITGSYTTPPLVRLTWNDTYFA